MGVAMQLDMFGSNELAVVEAATPPPAPSPAAPAPEAAPIAAAPFDPAPADDESDVQLIVTERAPKRTRHDPMELAAYQQRYAAELHRQMWERLEWSTVEPCPRKAALLVGMALNAQKYSAYWSAFARETRDRVR